VTLTGETEVLGVKNCSGASLSTTNLTWTGLRSNPGLRAERPATNGVNHGTAYKFIYKINIFN
jgi:hypothetical protein